MDSGDRIDAETLAAFIDGRLPRAEHARILERLTRDREAYATLLDALEITRALEPATPVPTPARPGRRWLLTGALAAAAALALLWLRPASSGDLLQLPERLALPGGPALRELVDTPPWSATRGGVEILAAEQRSFRAGARVADLLTAARNEDREAWGSAAADLITLLGAIPGASALGAAWGPDLRPLPRAADLLDAGRQVRAAAGAPDWFDLGVWTETARLAAGSGGLDGALPGLLDGLARLERRAGVPGGLPEPLVIRLRSLAGRRDLPDGPGAWRALMDSVQAAGGG